MAADTCPSIAIILGNFGHVSTVPKSTVGNVAYVDEEEEHHIVNRTTLEDLHHFGLFISWYLAVFNSTL